MQAPPTLEVAQRKKNGTNISSRADATQTLLEILTQNSLEGVKSMSPALQKMV